MRRLRSTSLLLDVYGAFVRELGNWIRVADLVQVMDAVGVDEQAVRSSVSRYSRRGLLEREVRDGDVGYRLTDQALEILAEGDVRIYDRMEPARLADGWSLVTYSIPEEVREERHQLRTRLTWLGYGNLGGGLWIAPRRVLDRTVETVRELGLEAHVDVFEAHYAAFDDVGSLVARCWDLDHLRDVYGEFLTAADRVLADWEESSSGAACEAFADYVAVLHEWRKMPYMDPGLPPELLPDDWEGARAAACFERLRDLLEEPARRYVASVVASSS